ncbi:uncharacterized protein EDB91DRAFT_1082308 [Suillus paluster]|uniref:uncharacterized protein n=1 Tax=Suillus paluster TaxID=48578 RepID=UPI001B885EC4|nr:uncharacterized protein EDB91DRAFT_1082308 [Suillus paluster]KAG1739943.1 hypothetical protein EDB91DRAFT_1082308 [Suillus paluster]
MPPKNKGKKGKANDDDYWDTAGVSAENYNTIADKIGKSDDDDRLPIPEFATAEDEFPEPDQKSKKKKKKGKNDEDAVDAAPTPAPVHITTATAVEDEEDGEGTQAGESDLKKKKKKKGKKDEDLAPAAAPTPAPATALEEDEDGEEAEAGETDPKKKKKKKKGKKDEDVAPAAAPTPAPAKKAKGGIGALKALMEEKKRIEEEARRREEEERKRIEEEERQAEEEAKRKEEEKQRKKEKEKAKRELAKKEGRYLTKKQKEEKAAAELRRQALLASGVQIEGLHQQAGVSAKKVVSGNRKKKGPIAKEASASPAPESRPETPDAIPSAPSPVESAAEEETKDEVKDEWDASSGDESDESSEEEDMQSEVQTDVKVDPSPPVSDARTTGADTKAARADAGTAGSDTRAARADAGTAQANAGTARASASSARANANSAQAHAAAPTVHSKDNLRSPICCILGHVDTGKTKLLDKIRQTNVQEGEAGGITQQIGATYFPLDAIKTKTAVMNKADAYQDNSQEYKIPGLLVIDTPGHESFTNLRSRGSSLCNIAILVVDIMHGLEPQTLESLRLLRDKKTPFIVALNKIDRLYGWNETPDGAFQESLAKQKGSVQREFADRVQKTILAFAEQGLNAVLYYENKSFARNVSLVPTSAITGEGVPDMIMLLVNLTQQRMSDRLMYLSELECTVLEVKVIEGLGTTIDVVLSNGILREGDKIIVCGLNGPIVTQSAYVHHKEVKAALGVKLVAPDLDKAVAGSRLLVVGPDDDEEDMLDEVMSDLTSLLNSVDKSGRGVCVQASTLGSLEALLDFLKVSKIPVSGVNIGPVHKKDVMRAATMLEKAKELAVILCFDVTVDKDAEKIAEEMGIKVFKGFSFVVTPVIILTRHAADIIYHLFDAFTAYNNEMMEAKRRDAAPQAVWPCRLKIIAAFCKRDPIILGVDILDGTLRVGTPICVVTVDPATQKKEIINLGKVTSLEINHKSFDIVKKSQAGGGVAVKIEHAVYESGKMFGRHFDEKNELFSHITRQSIDVLKTSFKADVSNEEWLLIKALKPRTAGPGLFIAVDHSCLIDESFFSFTTMSRDSSTGAQTTDEVVGDSESGSIADKDALQLVILFSTTEGNNLAGNDAFDITETIGNVDLYWHLIESFAASFVALNFIGGVRSFIFLGLLAGGPAAIWSSYLITMVFMFMTAAVLAEICSALPLSGSIYIWAAESAGPKHARFFGFLVAWWACTAWMTFTASNCQTTANYIVSQLAVWEVDFPGGVGNDNIRWRALIWAISEGMLLLSVTINYLPPKFYSGVFKFSVGFMMLDFFLCLIWLPIGVSNTYGFRSAKDVFTMTYNGTGAPAGWNWLLSLLFTAGTLTGFDASGHIAEETKNASVVAAKGILWSAIATGVLGFITTILFLFCTPDLDTMFALDAPQPFVQIYALALGKKASIFMTVIAVIGLIMNTTVAIVASSRLVFAVARDGVLPLSQWIGTVDSKGQPRNAVTVIYIFAAILLCTILPSQVAFTSLVSAGAVPTIAAYGLIALLRLTMTPNHFQSSHFKLGKYAKPFYVCAVLFNALVFAVDISPFEFPVNAGTFNFAVVIFGAISIFAFLSWYFTPEEKWLRKDQILKALETVDHPEDE